RVPLGETDIVDREPGQRVVVDDGPLALAAGGRGVRGVAQVDEPGVVGLVQRVGGDGNGGGPGSETGSESQGTAGGGIVAAGRGSAAARGGVDRDRLVAGVGQADGEGERRGAGVPLGGRDAGDGE